mmetsp:Transcript_87165/g.219470  ORF Transcript_87165/g.219470 Transcript_87165/m.219470 type:complete len:276 (-) Transcript_87165:501-1328(-)
MKLWDAAPAAPLPPACSARRRQQFSFSLRQWAIASAAAVATATTAATGAEAGFVEVGRSVPSEGKGASADASDVRRRRRSVYRGSRLVLAADHVASVEAPGPSTSADHPAADIAGTTGVPVSANSSSTGDSVATTAAASPVGQAGAGGTAGGWSSEHLGEVFDWLRIEIGGSCSEASRPEDLHGLGCNVGCSCGWEQHCYPKHVFLTGSALDGSSSAEAANGDAGRLSPKRLDIGVCEPAIPTLALYSLLLVGVITLIFSCVRCLTLMTGYYGQY